MKIIRCFQLDREIRDHVDLVVTAVDNGVYTQTGSVMVSIDITDVNDNAPVIQTTTTVINVKEGMPIGSKIAKIDASDQDIGANGEIRFGIKNYDDKMLPFDINDKTGDISVTKGKLVILFAYIPRYSIKVLDY